MTKTYLFLKQHTLDSWRELAETSHVTHYNRLLAQARSYADHLPPREHPTDTITYIGMAVANMSLAYVLSQDRQYFDWARQWIQVAINYPHWGKARKPDHDLDAAWLLFGLGLGYDWLKAELPQDERDGLRTKLHLQGQRLYDYAVKTEGTPWSSAYWQNHNWICYSGLATVAYSLQCDYSAETQAWADRAYENFCIALPLMADDGSDYEGPVYWRYGFMWFLIYAHLIQEQTGIDLHDSGFLRNAFDYRLYLSAPNLINTANIGDCHDRRSAHSAAVNYRLASLYRIGHAQWLTDHFHVTGEWEREGREGLVKPGYSPELWLEFVWYDPSVEPKPLTEMPLVKAFPDLGLVSMRSSWESDATFMTFKCGAPSGHKAWHYGQAINRKTGWQTISAGHAHPDENGIILVKGEDYLAIDDGYNRAVTSRHHSTVLVDGQGQYREGTNNVFQGLDFGWGGRLEDVFASGNTAYVCGETARAYDPTLGLQRFKREVLFVAGDWIVLRDTLVATDPRRFEWLMQSDATPKPLGDNTFTLRVGSTSASIQVFEPKDLTWDHFEQEIATNPTSAKPDWLLYTTLYGLGLSPKEKTTNAEFLVAMTLDEEQTLQPLDPFRGKLWQGETEDGRTLIGLSNEQSGISLPDRIETDAAWLVVNEPHEWHAGSVTHLWLDNQPQVIADSPLTLCHEKRAGAWVYRLRTIRPTWISLYSLSDELLGSREVTNIAYNDELSLIRFWTPAGEHTVQINFGGT